MESLLMTGSVIVLGVLTLLAFFGIRIPGFE